MTEQSQQLLAKAIEKLTAQGLDPMLARTGGAAAYELYKFVRAHGTAGLIALGLVYGLVEEENQPFTDPFTDGFPADKG